ncbi:hypothetical protein MHBO_002394, partial [Bonamia ostreae]
MFQSFLFLKNSEFTFLIRKSFFDIFEKQIYENLIKPTAFKRLICVLTTDKKFLKAFLDSALLGDSNRMSSYKKNEEKDLHWTTSIKKSQLLQKVKNFGKSGLDSTKCYDTVVKLTFLLNSDEKFSTSERSDIFFCSTKLFQNANPNVRRLVYHIISELEHDPEAAFMAINALLKDLTSLNSPKKFRANA